MAGLGALKRTMSFTIIMVFIIFLGLILVVSFFFLDPFQGLVLAIVGSVFIILFQYAVGPVIVRATSRLHYLAPGENRWLESKVAQLASQSNIPMPRIAISHDPKTNAISLGRTIKVA